MDRRTLRGPLYAGEAFSAQAAGPARPNLPDSKGLRHYGAHAPGALRSVSCWLRQKTNASYFALLNIIIILSYGSM